MKVKWILITAYSILAAACFGQSSDAWNKWSWLIGGWKGEGGGQPGQGGGTFSFNLDLDKKILVRKSHSEYPSTGNRPATVHEDLMVIYLDSMQTPNKAVYFDNEGHVIHYAIAYPNQSIVLTSEKIPDTPVFRLSYTPIDSAAVIVKFEMSRDGVTFMTYVEGKSKREK